MKKEGFISTTLVYTFLILFLFLLLSILSSYAQKNKFIDAIKEKIYEDLSVIDTNDSGDIFIVAMYVDGIKTDSLDINKNYALESYTCTNNEEVIWNNGLKLISIIPLTKTTKCTLRFNEYNFWYDSCDSSSDALNCKIIANTNCTTNSTVTSCTPQTDNSIQFNQLSSATNGLGLYFTEAPVETEDYNKDGTADRVYYYRGAVENNHVSFGGYCWRIIRTNEDGSIRMRFNGGWNGSICPATGTPVNTTRSKFNDSWNNAKYNEYVQSDGTSSTIKTVVEQWYTNNIENSPLNTNNALTDRIANVPYCSDKTNPTSPTSGNFTPYTFYGAANRFTNITSTYSAPNILLPAQPIFKCNDSEHKHTASGDTWNGNEKLKKPVGLITADEVIYAGGAWTIGNNTFYLKNDSYWTMSPNSWGGGGSNFYANSFTVEVAKSLYFNNVNISYNVLPVISLKSNVVVSSGNGSYTQPYIVGPN